MDMLPPPAQSVSVTDCERELTAEEIQSFVAPQYAATGNSLPDPANSTFIGVIRGGEVVAALGLQLKLHAQPLMISDGHSAVLPLLVKTAESIILSRIGPQWVYLFCPAGRLSQIAQSMGMQLEPWCVLSKLVAPEMPAKISVEPVPEPQDDLLAELIPQSEAIQ